MGDSEIAQDGPSRLAPGYEVFVNQAEEYRFYSEYRELIACIASLR